MYLSRAPDVGRPAPGTGRRWGRVAPNVVFLGLTSLFTDVSSEMVNAILPLYLTFELRWTPLQFGVFDGFYQGVSGLLRLAGGLVADRRRRYKEVAAAGYGLSALCKLGLLAVGNGWVAITAVLFIDRTGKGIRTAPRDALVSLSSPAAGLGWAFGVHRALDTIGAMAGPLLAFVILTLVPGAFDLVFLISFCAAVVGLGILGLFVENRVPEPASPGVSRPPSLRRALALLLDRRFRSVVIAGALLSLATVSDAFVYLTLQRQTDLRLGYFPVLYVGTAAVYLLLAAPVGRLADRVGRGRVLLAGHFLLFGVYAVLLQPRLGAVGVVAGLVLLGVYYAATDGVLMALASSIVPADIRTSGLAVLTTAIAGARLLASVLFGALWTWAGPTAALRWFSVGLVGALVAAAILLRDQPGISHEGPPATAGSAS